MNVYYSSRKRKKDLKWLEILRVIPWISKGGATSFVSKGQTAYTRKLGGQEWPAEP